MIKYLSTGEFWEKPKKSSRFIQRQASRGNGANIYQRNYEDNNEYDFKSSAHAKDYDHAHSQYHKINKTYKEKPHFFGTQHGTTQAALPPKVVDNQYFLSAQNQNLNEPWHLNNWKIYKEKKFSQRAQKEATIAAANHGSIIPQNDYKMRLTQSQIENTKSTANLPTECLFQISKPLLRLDKEQKEYVPKKGQSVSEDLPAWCVNNNQLTNDTKNYKKKLLRRIKETDIFGNKLIEPNKDPNNKVFQDVPREGQIHEKTRMGVFYDNQDYIRKTMTVNKIKSGNVKIEWKESPEKQHYDIPIREKIGSTQNLYIKELEQKRDPNFPKLEKIGQPEVYKRMDRDKPILLKIGHGEPSTLNPVKY